MRSSRNVACTLIGLLLVVSGCATETYFPTSDAGTQQLKIKAGDEIRVVTTRRERLSFKVTEVRADRFVGVTGEPYVNEHRPAGASVEVPFSELALFQVTRFSPGHAAVVVLLVGGMVAAVAAIPAAGLPAAAPVIVP